jgi:hypothetical protein
MRFTLKIATLLMALYFIGAALSPAQDATKGGAQAPVAGSIDVTGKLTKMMAIGAETTGWAIEFDNEQTIAGKPLKSIEVEGKPKRLAKLENQQVKATGTIVHKTGVETGDRLVLQLEKIRAVNPSKSATTASQPK